MEIVVVSLINEEVKINLIEESIEFVIIGKES